MKMIKAFKHHNFLISIIVALIVITSVFYAIKNDRHQFFQRLQQIKTEQEKRDQLTKEESKQSFEPDLYFATVIQVGGVGSDIYTNRAYNIGDGSGINQEGWPTYMDKDTYTSVSFNTPFYLMTLSCKDGYNATLLPEETSDPEAYSDTKDSFTIEIKEKIKNELSIECEKTIPYKDVDSEMIPSSSEFNPPDLPVKITWTGKIHWIMTYGRILFKNLTPNNSYEYFIAEPDDVIVDGGSRYSPTTGKIQYDDVVIVSVEISYYFVWNDGVDDTEYRGCVPWINIEKIETLKNI